MPIVVSTIGIIRYAVREQQCSLTATSLTADSAHALRVPRNEGLDDTAQDHDLSSTIQTHIPRESVTKQHKNEQRSNMDEEKP